MADDIYADIVGTSAGMTHDGGAARRRRPCARMASDDRRIALAQRAVPPYTLF